VYQLIRTSGVIRLSDGASIPQDQGNRDWREYLDWVAAGNTPLPATAQVDVASGRDGLHALVARRSDRIGALPGGQVESLKLRLDNLEN
jgi:hypothetical protein